MKNVKIALCAVALAGGALVAGPLTSASGAPAAPVKAPSGPSTQSTVVGTSTTIAPGSYGSVTTSCAGSKKVTGGGGSTSGFDIDIIDTYPSGNGWTVGGVNRGATSQTLTGYAVCLGLV